MFHILCFVPKLSLPVAPCRRNLDLKKWSIQMWIFLLCHFENWLGKTGCSGGMYGCFWCFEKVRNGHRWVTMVPPTQVRWFDSGELLLVEFNQLLQDFNHFEKLFWKIGCFGGMYGSFWCFEGDWNGQKWVTNGPPTQKRWFDGRELLFGRFQPTVMGY